MNRFLLSVWVLMVIACPVLGADGDRILGLWTTPDDDCKIEIFPCGEKYCGRIAELKERDYPAGDEGGMAGKPKVDRENPNPALRNRPLLGLQLMEGFTYAGKSVWEKGTIYNPDNGKSYKSKVSLSAPGRLEVRGYIGIPLFGGTSIWTR
jgi:uncharacterized protein (DUF2147 family)